MGLLFIHIKQKIYNSKVRHRYETNIIYMKIEYCPQRTTESKKINQYLLWLKLHHNIYD